jgi:hypothetical protein
MKAIRSGDLDSQDFDRVISWHKGSGGSHRAQVHATSCESAPIDLSSIESEAGAPTFD